MYYLTDKKLASGFDNTTLHYIYHIYSAIESIYVNTKLYVYEIKADHIDESKNIILLDNLNDDNNIRLESNKFYIGFNSNNHKFFGTNDKSISFIEVDFNNINEKITKNGIYEYKVPNTELMLNYYIKYTQKTKILKNNNTKKSPILVDDLTTDDNDIINENKKITFVQNIESFNFIENKEYKVTQTKMYDFYLNEINKILSLIKNNFDEPNLNFVEKIEAKLNYLKLYNESFKNLNLKSYIIKENY